MVYTTDMSKLQEKDVCRHGCVMLLMHSYHIDNGLLSTLKDTVLYEGIHICNDEKCLIESVGHLALNKCQALVYVKLSMTRSCF